MQLHTNDDIENILIVIEKNAKKKKEEEVENTSPMVSIEWSANSERRWKTDGPRRSDWSVCTRFINRQQQQQVKKKHYQFNEFNSHQHQQRWCIFRVMIWALFFHHWIFVMRSVEVPAIVVRALYLFLRSGTGLFLCPVSGRVGECE